MSLIDDYRDLEIEYEALKEENEENCRLLAMSADRELTLITKLNELQELNAKCALALSQAEKIIKDSQEQEPFCWWIDEERFSKALDATVVGKLPHDFANNVYLSGIM